MSILDRFRLDGRVALVTGAGKGIGKGTAIALAEAGADVVVASRTAADLEQTAREIQARGRRALCVPTDVTVTEQLEALVARAVGEFGHLDILVNNAGGWLPRPILGTSERSFEAALRFNVTQAFLLTRIAVPHLAATGNAAVVNISSRVASIVQPMYTAYATAKAALSMMTRAMAPELAPKIRINAIEVGGIETEAAVGAIAEQAGLVADEVLAFARRFIEENKRLDVLVNNAVACRRARDSRTNERSIDRTDERTNDPTNDPTKRLD